MKYQPILKPLRGKKAGQQTSPEDDDEDDDGKTAARRRSADEGDAQNQLSPDADSEGKSTTTGVCHNAAKSSHEGAAAP